MEKCKASALALGDTVQTFEGPFASAVVTFKGNGIVRLYRPHAVTADFEYTGGVLAYVGIEVYEISESQEVTRLEKATPKL